MSTLAHLSHASGTRVGVSLGALDLAHVNVLHGAERLGRVGVRPVAAAGAFKSAFDFSI